MQKEKLYVFKHDEFVYLFIFKDVFKHAHNVCKRLVIFIIPILYLYEFDIY